MTNNIPQETINSVLLDILKGAKDAGGEIYGASKISVAKAVDFAQEQAPLVVQEFLAWKFAEALIKLCLSLCLIAILGYIAKKCWYYFMETDGESGLGVMFSMIFIVIIFSSMTFTSFEQMVKVKVAPRVYLIEWTSEQVNGKKANH